MRFRRPSASRESYLVDHLIGATLALAYLIVLVMTARGIGYARDEGFYFRAASTYAAWFELLLRDPAAAISRASVDVYWSNNHEHPALVKSLFGLSWNFLFKKWHLFAEEGTSYRFGGMCFAAAGLWLVHVWGARARSRAVGLVAALLFALMPRVFYHAHLDCFDVPIAVMWTLCAYCYWRSLENFGLGWAITTGVVFGLALDTKLNSWFLPPALVLHALLVRGRYIWRGLRRGQLRVPPALVGMAAIGPFVFFALWPWIWFDTVDRIKGYMQFHLNHDYYNMVFLGETYWKPPMPRAYAWFMTAATVPAVTLLLFFIGAGSRVRAMIASVFPARALARGAGYDPRGTDLLWAIGLFVQYAPWALSTNTPIFGGTKHWFTAYPFLCLFAGVGFQWVSQRLWALAKEGVWARVPLRAVDVALGAAVIAAPLAETVHSHPWGLSNYTPLVGGASGAATLGLNRQFWGFTTGAVTDWLNQHVSPGQTVYIHDTAGESWDMLHHDGRLLSHVAAAWSIPASTFALYHHEEHMQTIEYQIWASYGTSTPAYIGAYDGVPIIYVYAKPAQLRR
jgi:4-amino-4-deoxy-L-arabinose transferase-like glycosyltransferase